MKKKKKKISQVNESEFILKCENGILGDYIIIAPTDAVSMIDNPHQPFTTETAYSNFERWLPIASYHSVRRRA